MSWMYKCYKAIDAAIAIWAVCAKIFEKYINLPSHMGVPVAKAFQPAQKETLVSLFNFHLFPSPKMGRNL